MPAAIVGAHKIDTASVHSSVEHVLEHPSALPAPEVKQLSHGEVLIDWEGADEVFAHAAKEVPEEHHEEGGEEETKITLHFTEGSHRLSFNRSATSRHVLIDVLAQHLTAYEQGAEMHVGAGSNKITVRVADAEAAEIFFTHEYEAHGDFAREIVLPTEEQIEKALEAKEADMEFAAEMVKELAELEHLRHQHAHDHQHEHVHEHDHTHEHTHEHTHAHEHEHEHKEEEEEEHEHLSAEQIDMVKVAELVADHALPQTPAEAALKVVMAEAKAKALKEQAEHGHGHKEGHGEHKKEGGEHKEEHHEKKDHAPEAEEGSEG